jgi:exopolysaccharide biosynthesis predicted pyruvyltransferase EpsI
LSRQADATPHPGGPAQRAQPPQPPGADTHPDGALLDRLRRRAQATLASAMVPGPYALLDYPWYPNVGDHAIWLGTLAALRALGRPPPAYVASLDTYCPRTLRRRIGDGPILLQGGGNLGDLWPEHQAHREAVLRNHPENPVVQMPQSVLFRDPAARERARAAFGAHPRFTLLVRDLRSRERARAGLGIEPGLCPDLALCLPRARTPRPGPLPLRTLVRADRESAGPLTDLCDDAPREDWAGWPGRAEAFVQRALRRTLLRLRAPAGAHRAVWQAISARRLAWGRRHVGSAQLIVTDRLHGHVLCLLAGIPHVVVEDRFGKIVAFRDAWTREARLARSAAPAPREAGIRDAAQVRAMN